LIHHGLTPSDILLELEECYLSLSLLATDTVRVRIARRALEPRPSWAVVGGHPNDTQVDLSESAEAVVVTTRGTMPGMRVTLRKADLHLTIAFADGTPVLEDALPGATFGPTGARAVKRLDPLARIYGLGQRMGFLDKRGEAVTMWATDDPLHHPGRDALYQAIPFYMAVQPAGVYGLLLDSPALTRFDLGRQDPGELSFETAEPELDYYVIVGSTPKAVLMRYSELTGRMPLPPKWSLGYQQSRWSYSTASRVSEIAENFRSRKIPCDVIYLDIDYMDKYRVFTWDPERFPDPPRLIAEMKAKGFHVVSIVDPGVKRDPDYWVYREGIEQGHFAALPDGQVYVGRVWPGEAVFPDFLQSTTRKWWGDLHRTLLDAGVAGIWNDMNEPANFTDPAVTGLFKGTLPGEVQMGEPGAKQSHARVHNLYGHAMANATATALATLRPTERPFLVTRSGYAGIARYAAVWMGDNHSWWEHLLQAMPTCLGMGLSGVPFVGTDCGGFSGDATGELLVRWTQMGAFTPFFRNHSAAETRDQEPWAFGEATERLVADAIRLRYRFLPYIYSVFAEAHRTGLPVMRPLVLEFPDDPHTFNLSDQYLLGADLLVAPVYQRGAVRRMVYLPAGGWIDYWTGKIHPGGQYLVAEAPLERIPLFVRQGAILPLGPVVQHTGEVAEELILDIFGSGSTQVYADDGLSTAHMNGSASLTRVTCTVASLRTVVTVEPRQGSYRAPWTRFLFRLRGHGSPQTVTAHGIPVPWRLEGQDLVVEVPSGDRAGPVVLAVEQ
jgi:alpha-glucosidase